jgi:hypothetical protein
MERMIFKSGPAIAPHSIGLRLHCYKHLIPPESFLARQEDVGRGRRIGHGSLVAGHWSLVTGHPEKAAHAALAF